MQTSRRGFLRGRVNTPPPLRPPGAGTEISFHDTCTRCGDCARSCPEEIISKDKKGYPVIDPALGACTFCDACCAACETGALTTGAAWSWKARISGTCLSLNAVQCRICQDQCDHRAIRFRLQRGGVAEPMLDSDLCNGCGGCVGTCPVGAITLQQTQPHREPATC